MPLSSKWNNLDNAYALNRNASKVVNFPATEIREYVRNHSRRDSLLYNNRLFFGYVNPSDKRKQEYNTNRLFILEWFS